MLKLYETGIYQLNGKTIVTDPAQLPAGTTKEEASKGTIVDPAFKQLLIP